MTAMPCHEYDWQRRSTDVVHCGVRSCPPGSSYS